MKSFQRANNMATASNLNPLIFISNRAWSSNKLLFREARMHQTHIDNFGPIQLVFLVIILFCVLAFYFLSTIMAIKRNGPHTTAVVVLNICFGVTLFGWIIALVLASKQRQPLVVVYKTTPPSR
jgi:hypothetical protein